MLFRSNSDLEGVDEMVTGVNSKTTYKLVANISDADNFSQGVGLSVGLVANSTNIVAEDSEYDTATVDSSTVTSGDMKFYENIMNLGSLSSSSSTVGDASYLADIQLKQIGRASCRERV